MYNLHYRLNTLKRRCAAGAGRFLMFKIYKLPEIFMKNMSSFRDGTLLTL